jgi:hypothetical protein
LKNLPIYLTLLPSIRWLSLSIVLIEPKN